MRGILAVVVLLRRAGVSAYAGEPGSVEKPSIHQAFGSEPLSLPVEQPQSVSVQSPGERVVYVEVPTQPTWSGLLQ